MTAIILISIIILLLDTYAFKGIRLLSNSLSANYRNFITLIFWLVPFITIAGLFTLYFHRETFLNPDKYKIFYFVVGFFLLFYIPKLVFILFHLTDDVVTLLSRFISAFLQENHALAGMLKTIRESTGITRVGIIVAMIPFIATIYGMIWGKFNYTIQEVPLAFENLPPSFNGLKVVQISDMHIGSYKGHEKQLEKAIKTINAQRPDLLLFTGDMVNNLAVEAEAFVPLLSQLKATYGKYSILGNHDYGEYYPWKSEEEKQQNLDKLITHHKEMGFRLLMNESVTIRKDSSEISIIGVENWGSPPFPQYGDLKKALSNANGTPFKILLSHDPSHWDAEVIPQTDIDLTLSGHTHGLQYTVNLPGFRWSPVKWRYPRWAGLYQEGRQYLYINIGLGFIAFPARVGAPPEITVFTLEKK